MKYKIPLELLAAKFAAVDGHEAPIARKALAANPRHRELLLWLQAESIKKDGGLLACVEKFASQCASRIGTATMRNLGPKAVYSKKQRDAILDETPSAGWQFNSQACHHTKESKWLAENFWHNVQATRTNDYSPFEPPVKTIRHEDFIATLDRAAFHRLCSDYIGEFLPAEIYRVCTQKDAWFIPAWYCHDLPAALIEMMDAASVEAGNALAETAVFKNTLDAIRFAIEKKAFVRIDGGARSGKTESVRAIAAMHPGLCRLVTPDCIYTAKDFFGSMADTLGIERDYQTTAHSLRMKIDYIAAHCGLCWIYDEAHFLFPSVLTKSKRPTRLDWIRTHLIDRGSPVVIITTPQIYDPAARQLEEITKYNFEQWSGRIRRHIRLPEKISPDDILAIVKKKAPGLGEDWQEEIAQSSRLVKGSYLAAVQSIIDTAYWNAQTARRSTPNNHDLESAIAEVAPNAAPSPSATPPTPPAQRPLAVKRKRAVTPSGQSHGEIREATAANFPHRPSLPPVGEGGRRPDEGSAAAHIESPEAPRFSTVTLQPV